MYAKFDKLCKEKAITPYRVSIDTGISQSTLSEWKTGKSNPKLDKLIILAKYFNVSIEYFIT